MGADWSALTRRLKGGGPSVTLSWRQLEDIVGGMPRSSLDHPAWWSGDRPHTRAWRAAGYHVDEKTPGVKVRFVRDGVIPAEPPARTDDVAASTPRDNASARTILVSCAKQKASEPMPARDLYTSSRFRKARAYAEASGHRWFILSGAHGLVAPHDWLAPYDLYLGDTTADYRRAWGEWVVARLELLVGDLAGQVIELHAGSDYVAPLRPRLEGRGARLEAPLDGLSTGRILAWYGARAAPTSRATGEFAGDPTPAIHAVSARAAALPASSVDSASLPPSPGLYGWFVDAAGATDLSDGLGRAVEPGLVYVGQTGATKWPTGTASGATLRGRINAQHLGGRRSSSTLRRTFGAVLDRATGRQVSRMELSLWMRAHLSVAVFPVDDPETLGDLERQVVQALDPPLNLDHTQPSPVRQRLRELRARTPKDLG